MTTTGIALLSTCIGAGAGIFSQFIANILRDKTDKKKSIINCVSEERKLAHIIFIQARRLQNALITTEYYYQLSCIQENENEKEKQSQKYHDELKFCGNASKEYNMLLGDYCKNVYEFLMYTSESKKIENILSKIMSHKFNDSVDIFKKYDRYEKLYEVYRETIKMVEIQLKNQQQLFDEIYKEIKEIVK